jgi:cardiolipin synthase A/B
VQQVWPYLVGALVAFSAIAASLHAIFTKRHVGAAVAWVGLIWLSPIVGAVLYVFLGINRIHRRASALRASSAPYRGTVAIPPVEGAELLHFLGGRFEHLLGMAQLSERVTVRPLLSGNRIEPLHDGDAAYPAMLAAIDEARASVSLATYIFDNDRAGRAFRDALARAVARGVEVRVLIDDGGRALLVSLHGPRAAPRRRARRALPSRGACTGGCPTSTCGITARSSSSTGGSGSRAGSTSARATGWPRSAHPSRDLHFRVKVPVVAELQEVFAEDWTFATGERAGGRTLVPRLSPRGYERARHQRRARHRLREATVDDAERARRGARVGAHRHAVLHPGHRT